MSFPSAMYEDLGIAAACEKSSLADLGAFRMKSSPRESLKCSPREPLNQCAPDGPPLSARRRPRPPTLVRATAPPSELPITPRPPLVPLPPAAGPRPSSLPRLGSAGARPNGLSAAPRSRVAEAEAGADAEMLRMRFSIGELQAMCDRQAKEIAHLRQQVSASDAQYDRSVASLEIARAVPAVAAASSPRVPAASSEQACQTEEHVFNQQIDNIHKEAALKGKEVRKLQETVKLLRAELQQEKLVSEQFREQVDGLDTQLKGAMLKQHQAESELSLGNWRLRNAEGAGRMSSMSRSCTPSMAASQRLIKAWAEPGRTGDDSQPMPSGGPMDDEDSESDAGPEEAALESDGSEEIEVYHPPPSRGGLRR